MTSQTRTRIYSKTVPSALQRPIVPRWLLKLARELADPEAGRGLATTRRRRAISTACYALFHALTLGTARHALPGGTDEEIQRAARHISHGAIKQVAAWMAGDQPPRHLTSVVARLRQNDDLTAVATAFTTLNEQREEADYDHQVNLTRKGTLTRVQQAERTVELLETNASEDDFRSFLGLILLRTSLR